MNLSQVGFCLGTNSGEQEQWELIIILGPGGTSGDLPAYSFSLNSTGQLNSSVPELQVSLQPGINSLSSPGTNATFQQWIEFVGRTIYVLYWLYLADLGQTAEMCNLTATHDIVNPANIFVNETLYRNYLVYYSNPSTIRFVPFTAEQEARLNSSFRPFQPDDTTFLQTYSCQQRQSKSGLSLFLALIIADYPFIVGGFSLVIWLAATFWQKRQKGYHPPLRS